ncbi:hypothetical protein [Streptomyces griseorubiginosus]|uniref:Uncharacterized protein n=1 Tax=Streptomyces griseorubiginosus TaxID=67304 RepID=A0AAI8L7X3_9ACTN|nr:hypothetical protein [Streptomyces griseorubiginosus]AYC43137.1 hypothetical protein DWG14_07443 [Streptomyces griseorubiginosus]
MVATFDRAQFNADETAVRKRLEKYGLHKDPEFMTAFDGYMHQLSENGRWIEQGHTPNENWAGTAADDLMAQFDRLNALHVPAQKWRDAYKEHRTSISKAGRFTGAFTTKLTQIANEARRHKYLWSKTEPYYPAKKAAADGGMILETSPPGKILNGMDFGFERWSDAPVQARLWTQMSDHYVDGAEGPGPVKAIMLGGRVASSVLSRYEWPHLEKMIKAGKVPHMHVKLMGWRNESEDSANWSLTTRDSFNVHSQGTFDRIPSPDSDFADKQNRWRGKEKARNASSSSSSPSSSGQSSSSGGVRLESFHEVFDDPTAVVCMSDPYAAGADISVSPEELSRASSGGGVLLSTEGLTGDDLTRVNVLNEMAALEAGKQSLREKLANFESQQQRRMSAATGAWNTEQLTQGMSRMSPYGPSSGDVSPRTAAPHAGYFPQPTAQSPFPTSRYGVDPTLMASYGVTAPVQGIQRFHPTAGTYDNTGYAASHSSGGVPLGSASSYSDSSGGGVPLGYSSSEGGVSVGNRTPSPKEFEQPAPAPAESASKPKKSGGGGGGKNKKEPSAALKWLAGASKGPRR